jgi:amidase
LLLAAEATGGFDDPQYRGDRLRDIALSRTAGIDAALAASKVDVLLAPMGAAAKYTGKAGAPAFAIPAGLDAAGMPFGVTLYTSRGRDRHLLEVGITVANIIGQIRAPDL